MWVRGDPEFFGIFRFIQVRGVLICSAMLTIEYIAKASEAILYLRQFITLFCGTRLTGNSTKDRFMFVSHLTLNSINQKIASISKNLLFNSANRLAHEIIMSDHLRGDSSMCVAFSYVLLYSLLSTSPASEAILYVGQCITLFCGTRLTGSSTRDRFIIVNHLTLNSINHEVALISKNLSFINATRLAHEIRMSDHLRGDWHEPNLQLPSITTDARQSPSLPPKRFSFGCLSLLPRPSSYGSWFARLA